MLARKSLILFLFGDIRIRVSSVERVLDDFVEFSSSYVSQVHDEEIERLRGEPRGLSNSSLVEAIYPMALPYHYEREIF